MRFLKSDVTYHKNQYNQMVVFSWGGILMTENQDNQNNQDSKDSKEWFVSKVIIVAGKFITAPYKRVADPLYAHPNAD